MRTKKSTFLKQAFEVILRNTSNRIFYTEILIAFLALAKLFVISSQQSATNELLTSAVRYNTMAVHQLQVGKFSEAGFLKSAEGLIEKSTAELMSYYGKTTPSCYFGEGTVPYANGKPSDITYKYLKMAVKTAGPAGPLFDLDLAKGIKKADGTACENTIESVGIQESVKREILYGNTIEMLLAVLALLLLILKYFELKHESKYPPKRYNTGAKGSP